MSKKTVPIVMISDDNFIMPTCVTITSLLQNKAADTFYDIFILMAECQESSEQRVQMLEQEGCAVHIVRASLEKYNGIKQHAHISRAALLKFDICNLIPQYDKVLYLDGDIIVREDLAPLYDTDLKGSYAAGVKEMDSMVNDRSNINSGVLVYNTKRMRDEGLSEVLLKTRISLGDRGSMDQQTFNIVFRTDVQYLPLRYNCVIGFLLGNQRDPQYTPERINQTYHTHYKSVREAVDDAGILHFATGEKPWVFTFTSGAKEWYRYYLLSPYKDVPFKLRGRWSYRLEKMRDAWKQQGMSGVMARLQDKWKHTFGKKEGPVDWE